jgi:hypothetical protein
MLTPGERVLSVAETKALDYLSGHGRKAKIMDDIWARSHAWMWLGNTELGGYVFKGPGGDPHAKSGPPAPADSLVTENYQHSLKYKVMQDIDRRAHAWDWLGSTELGGTIVKGVGDPGTKGIVGYGDDARGQVVHKGDIILHFEPNIPKGDVNDHAKVIKIVHKNIADKGELFQTVQTVAQRTIRKMAG